tara:strand:- start:13779 stop:13961 length:183 start_codon:yes stop_codon:yes gene_type:complete
LAKLESKYKGDIMKTITRIFNDGGKITIHLKDGVICGVAGAMKNRDFKRFLDEIKGLKNV